MFGFFYPIELFLVDLLKTERLLLLEQLIILCNSFVHRFSILQELVSRFFLGLDQVQLVGKRLILVGRLCLYLSDLLLIAFPSLLQGVF